ncbi:MAG: hypothetical protein ACYDCO_05445 [Armatimonadota bacterium]
MAHETRRLVGVLVLIYMVLIVAAWVAATLRSQPAVTPRTSRNTSMSTPHNTLS